MVSGNSWEHGENKHQHKKRWHNITAKYKSDGDEPLHPAVPESLGLYYQ
jgi:hypothetical protein